MSRADLRHPRVVVVGGGISGLAAAWRLRQRLGERAEVVVLEKNRRIGGHLQVGEVAGVPVDTAAESMLFRRPEAADLARAVGLGADLQHPRQVGARLLHDGELRPLPTGTIMGVPGDLGGLRHGGLFTETEVAALRSRDVEHDALEHDAAVAEVVADRLGPAVVDRLVEPLLGGVYAGRAEELSLQATIPALYEALRSPGRLTEQVRAATTRPTTSTQPVFVGISGGVGRLPAAVAAAAGAEVRIGTTVRELHRTPAGWTLTVGPTTRPELVHADAVVLAVPAAATARLLRDVAPSAAAELGTIETASMAIVTLAVPAGGLDHLPAISGYLVPPRQARTLKAATFSSVKWPWSEAAAAEQGVVVLRASVGRHRDPGELRRDDDEVVDAVRADLATVGIEAAPVASRVDRWGGALPQYAVGHVERVARVRAAVDTLPGLAVCGAAYDGVGIPACIAAADLAVAEVLADLGPARVKIDP